MIGGQGTVWRGSQPPPETGDTARRVDPPPDPELSPEEEDFCDLPRPQAPAPNGQRLRRSATCVVGPPHAGAVSNCRVGRLAHHSPFPAQRRAGPCLCPDASKGLAKINGGQTCPPCCPMIPNPRSGCLKVAPGDTRTRANPVRAPRGGGRISDSSPARKRAKAHLQRKPAEAG